MNLHSVLTTTNVHSKKFLVVANILYDLFINSIQLHLKDVQINRLNTFFSTSHSWKQHYQEEIQHCFLKHGTSMEEINCAVEILRQAMDGSRVVC